MVSRYRGSILSLLTSLCRIVLFMTVFQDACPYYERKGDGEASHETTECSDSPDTSRAFTDAIPHFPTLYQKTPTHSSYSHIYPVLSKPFFFPKLIKLPITASHSFSFIMQITALISLTTGVTFVEHAPLLPWHRLREPCPLNSQHLL